MMEILTVVSKIAMNFDLSFASDDEDGSHFDVSWQDTFVLTLADLPLRFSVRQKY